MSSPTNSWAFGLALAMLSPALCVGADSLRLDEAVERARRGASLSSRVDARVGKRAARRVSYCEGADLAALCRVVLAAGCEAKLPLALSARFRRGDPALVCEVMLGLPWDLLRDEVARMVQRSPRSFELGAAFELRIRLLSATSRAKAIRAAVLGGDLGRAKLLVRTSVHADQGLEIVVALASLDLPGDVDDLRWITIRSITREDSVAEQVLALAKENRPELLSALTRTRPSLRGQAREHLERLLAKGQRSPRLLRPALELKAKGCGPLALQLARRGEVEVRLRALQALPRLAKRAKDSRFTAKARESLMASLDVSRSEIVQAAALRALGSLEDPPIELLLDYTESEFSSDIRHAAIKAASTAREERGLPMRALALLLDDPEVSQVSLKALVRLSGVRLPPRASLWRTWIARNLDAPGNDSP